MKEPKSSPFSNYRMSYVLIFIIIVGITTLAKWCSNRDTENVEKENKSLYSKKMFAENAKK